MNYLLESFDPHYWKAWCTYKKRFEELERDGLSPSKKEEEMSIPLEVSMHTYGLDAETELSYLLSDDVFRYLDEEEKEQVIIDPFVKDMCNYYKLQDDYAPWQHYYNYLLTELGTIAKAQSQFNEEMKRHIEETKLGATPDPTNTVENYHDKIAIWNALEKHK